MRFGEVLLSPVSASLDGIRRMAVSSDRAAGLALTGGVVAAFSALMRGRCTRNMEAVFGPLGWTAVDIESLRLRHVSSLTEQILDMMALAETRPRSFLGTSVLEGEEHLREALGRGKGVMLLTSHLGSPMHLRAALGARGYRVAIVANRLPIRAMESMFDDIRDHFGVRVTHVGNGAASLAESAITGNGIFSASFDIAVPQRESRAGWHACGHAAMLVDHGPARLLLRTGAALLWGSVRKLPDGRFHASLEPLRYSTEGEREELASAMTEEWMAKLYGDLLERPEEWWHWNNLILSPGLPRASGHPRD